MADTPNINPIDLAPLEGQVLRTKIEMYKNSQVVADVVRDNPDFRPWVVVIPYLRDEDTAMQHAMVFVRARDASNAANLAISWWSNKLQPMLTPKWYPPGADYQGKVAIRALDEGDYKQFFDYIWKKARVDFEKWPLYAMGAIDHHCTGFHSPWFEREEHDFAEMRSSWLDNQKFDAAEILDTKP